MRYSILIISILSLTAASNQKKQTPKNTISIEDYATFAYEKLIEDVTTIDRVFFAPQEATIIEAVLIGLIRSTQTAIVGALFRLSNKRIIDELIEAHKRGVLIDIILDPEAISASKEISRLSHAGITLALFSKKKYGTYMHHKFLIFKNTLVCSTNPDHSIEGVVAYGSLNLTEHGFQGNRENINFRNKKEVIDAFLQEIINLKEGTDYYILSPRRSSSQSSYFGKNKSPEKFFVSCLKTFNKIAHEVKHFLKLFK